MNQKYERRHTATEVVETVGSISSYRELQLSTGKIGVQSNVEDGEVRDGWWDVYPLGQHARVKIPVD